MRSGILAGLAILIAVPAMAQPADFAAEARRMTETAYPADGPGAAVVVMRNGTILYAGGRGIADLATRRAITPDTRFRLGSITKQFVAAVVLQLVAEGRIALDDPLSRFLPDFPAPGAGATVRQLLNHSSGVMDYTKIPGWMLSPPSLEPNTTAQLVALIASKSAVSPPGTRWEYNNSGYVLLGAIIEKVTGRAWHEAVVERIARPLGLKSIAYAGAVEDGTARGYTLEDGRAVPARPVHVSVAHAAGGLAGSAADLARWARTLHHGRVVRADLYREMTSPAQLTDGSTRPYGFGLRLREIRGRPALVHGGAARGVDTDSVYLPSADLYVAVLANSSDPPVDPATLTRQLAALALGQPVPSLSRVPLAIAAVEPLFGSYGGGSGPVRRFFARDGKLYLGVGDEEAEVFAAGGDRFMLDPLISFRIERRPDGNHAMEIDRVELAAPVRLVRTGAVPPPLTVGIAVLRSYTGRYATEGPVIVIALDAQGRLTMDGGPQGTLMLRPVSQTEFMVDQARMRVVFHPEGGRVGRLTIYRGPRVLNGKRTEG